MSKYEEFTNKDFESELEDIKYSAEDYEHQITHGEDKESVLRKEVDSLNLELSEMEEFVPDELWEMFNDVYDAVASARLSEYESEVSTPEPDYYAEYGLKRSDFY